MRKNYTPEEKEYIKELFMEQLNINLNNEYCGMWSLTDNIRLFMSKVYYDLKWLRNRDWFETLDCIIEIALCLYSKKLIKKHTLGLMLREYLDCYSPYLPCYHQMQIEECLRDRDLATSYMGVDLGAKQLQPKIKLYTVFPDCDWAFGGPCIFWTQNIIYVVRNSKNSYMRQLKDVVDEIKNAPYLRYMKEDLERHGLYRSKEFSADEILAVRGSLYIVKNHFGYNN